MEPNTPDGVAAWTRVRARLRSQIGEVAYKSWVRPLTLLEIRSELVRLAMPTRFMRDFVASNYGEGLLRCWREEHPGVSRIDVVVRAANSARTRPGVLRPHNRPLSGRAAAPLRRPEPETKGPRTPERGSPSAKESPACAEPSKRAGPAIEPSELDAHGLGAPLDPRLIFDTFVVGKPNELAYAAARRVAEADTVPFNPLFLYGGVGLGKTHLMSAIAWEIRQRRPDRRVLYLSAETFMNLFIAAVRTKDTSAFKEEFRSVDVLMVDDVHFMGGKDMTQEEFFHTFNALVDKNRQVVLSADKSPSDLEGVEERLRSRLGWGLVTDIHPTTYELRLGILQSKAERLGVAIPPKLLEFLAHKITSSIRELEGALNRVAADAILFGRPITMEHAHETLRDLLRANDRQPTIEEIQKKVAEFYNIRLFEMGSARRARVVARPRQVAMYLCKQLTNHSLPEIGRHFGGRDHTTVMHAVKRVEEIMDNDRAFAEEVELLRRMLEG